MREHYLRELEQLHLQLLMICTKVVNQIEESIVALNTNDKELAAKVVEDDRIVDNMERDIESKCFYILLREQPVAHDFRRVSTALKMITDLERIGDHAADIASLVMLLQDVKAKDIDFIASMCELASKMVKKSVDGYIKEDAKITAKLPPMDEELDLLFIKAKSMLALAMRSNTYNCDDIVSLLMISKYLERIGDHAVNISEWTNYYQTGKK